MIRVLAFAAVFFVSASAWAQGACGDGWDPTIQGPGGVAVGDILTNGNEVCAYNETTDAAPDTLILKSGDCYAQGTQTASNLVLAGGLDEKKITVETDNATAADTITATVNGTALAALADGTAWVTCVGDTDAVCAVKVAAAITAQAGSGATCTSVAAVVYCQPTSCSTYSLSYAASDATYLVASNGTDGQILIPPGTPTLPKLAAVNDPDTGLSLGAAANRWYMVAGGVATMQYNGTGLSTGAKYLDFGGSYAYYSAGMLDLGGAVTSTHALDNTAGSVGISGALEVDGASYFDGNVLIPDNLEYWAGTGNDTFFGYEATQTPDATVIGVGQDSRVVSIIEAADIATDFQKGQQTNPTLCLQSADDTTLTDRICVAHNQTDGVLSTDGGDLVLSPAGGDVSFGGNDAYSLDDIYDSAAQATDAAVSPAANTISTSVPAAIVGATNTAGGNLALIPASGANNLTGVTCGSVLEAATLTITSVNLEGAVTTTTLTEGDGTGGTFSCNGGGCVDVDCVTNLAVVAAAAAAAGGYTYTAAAGTETGLFSVTPGTSVWVGVVASDTDLAITQGNDGQVLVPPGTAAAPSIVSWADVDSGIHFPGSNQVYINTNGTTRLYCTASACTLASATTLNVGSNYIYSSTAALDIGGACAPVGIADSTGATCVAGDSYFADRMTNKVETFADGDTTPDVAGSNFFLTPSNTGATAITDIDNPVAGQQVTICIGNANNPSTIADGGNFNLAGNWTPGIDDCIRLFVQADNDYIELGRVDN